MKSKKINLSSLYSHIDCLIENVDKKNINNNIDLILDGGVFNGAYQIGISLFLKRLEKKGYIKIDRISGCSIGSVVGFFYILNNLQEVIDNYDYIINHFRKFNNLLVFETILQKLIVNSDYDINIFNEKLFITYYDIENNKQIVKSKYNDKKDLFETIIKSCFIPYLINGNQYYENKYVDGITPYIFNKVVNKKILFIKLLSLDKILESIIIKNEYNIYSRLLGGILDISNFYNNKKSSLCSYIDNWKFSDYFFIRIRCFLFLSIVIFIEILVKYYKKIPVNIKKSFLISNINLIIKNLYRDFLNTIIL